MIYIFLGLPGSGKGTISNYLSINNNFIHISTGNMFREIIKSKTAIGEKLKVVLNSGNLVNDELTFKVLEEELKKYNFNKQNIILDGYTRNLSQAQHLENYFLKNNIKNKVIINFVISEKIIIERLENRLICPFCSRVYNSILNKPKSENYCDYDNQELIKRNDDELSTILIRIKKYNNETKSLLNFYKNTLVNINVNDSIKSVTNKILKLNKC